VQNFKLLGQKIGCPNHHLLQHYPTNILNLNTNKQPLKESQATKNIQLGKITPQIRSLVKHFRILQLQFDFRVL